MKVEVGLMIEHACMCACKSHVV